MRFHVVPLPHTSTSKKYNSCAYTIKVYSFIKMMASLGHEVFHYGAEDSEVSEWCTHVTVKSNEEHLQWFGPQDKSQFYGLDWTGQADYWSIINTRTANEINARKKQGDFLCIIGGVLHKPVVDMTGGDVIAVEFGIGYDGTFANFRVYESYAHMHKIIGAQRGYDADGKFYEVVIPNYIDPEDLTFTPTPTPAPNDYFLYLGRMIKRKGIAIAVETCKRIGAKLIIVGQGCSHVEGNKIFAQDGEVYEGDNLHYFGPADVKQRNALMGNAKAVFVPTIYIEPFGTVNVEAQMCGTPVITTDYGVFPETVEHGKTGYRCRTLDQFVWAAKNVDKLDRQYIHDRALANWSIYKVRHMYHEYFSMLSDLWSNGWYSIHEDRNQLDWLVKK